MSMTLGRFHHEARYHHLGAAIIPFSARGGGSPGEGKKPGSAVSTGDAITASPGQVEDLSGNISAAEWTHMDAVAAVLAAYGLADPVTTDQVGAFRDPAMADLYAKLVATGLASSDASLAVGATIEDLDISDISA